MTIKLSGAPGRYLAGSALGAFMAVAFIPTAMAQWMAPWGAPFPGEIERGLEAQGYVLTAPLMRRPGVYLADVSAGPAGHQRLIIDARSGQVLERFTAPGRNWGPALAARDGEFGEPQPGGVGLPLGPGFAGPPAARSAYGGPANVHIPAAVSPYGVGETRAGTKAKLKSAPTEHKATPRLCPLPLHVKRREWTDQARRRPSRPRTTIPSSRGSTPIRPTSATASRPPCLRLKARPPRRVTSRRSASFPQRCSNRRKKGAPTGTP
jgi:hypothetical protein